MEWCRRNLEAKDVVFTRAKDTKRERFEITDISLAITCDHSITSFGSYSFWIAFLKTNSVTIHPTGYWEHETLKIMPDNHWISMDDPCLVTVNDKIKISNDTICTPWSWNEAARCQQSHAQKPHAGKYQGLLPRKELGTNSPKFKTTTRKLPKWSSVQSCRLYV